MNVTSALVRRGAALTATVCTIAAFAAAPSALANGDAAAATSAAATTTTATPGADTTAGGIATTPAADAIATVTSATSGETSSHDSLSAAIAAASAGDTVTLTASTGENVAVSKKITVTAAEGAIYSGTMSVHDGATITGMAFELTGANGTTTSVSVIGAGDVHITKNTFALAANAATNSYYGVYLSQGAARVDIDGNTFTYQTVAKNKDRVAVNIQGNPTISDVRVTNNTLTVTGDDAGKGMILLVSAFGNNGGSDYGVQSLAITGNTVSVPEGIGANVQAASVQGVNGLTFTDNTVTNASVALGGGTLPGQNMQNAGVTVGGNALAGTLNGYNLGGSSLADGSITITKPDVSQPTAPAPKLGASLVKSDGTGAIYATLKEAIDVSDDGSTVTMQKNLTEDVTIPAGRTITLDLAGWTLTNKAGDTITNNGRLTVTDSSTGKTGVVDNVTHAKAALKNMIDATATLDGGTFKRSKEAGVNGNNGGNSYYTIQNFGDLTINEPTRVESKHADGTLSSGSSVIANGWYTAAENTNKATATLTINGGLIEGGNYVKNDYYGQLTINGGTIKGTSAAVYNYNVTTITGGDFSAVKDTARVLWNLSDENPDPAFGAAKLTISGGTIHATGNQVAIGQSVGTPTDGKEEIAQITITGGMFDGALADGLVNVRISGGRYTVRPSEGYLADGFEIYGSDGNYGVKEEVTPTPPPASKQQTTVTGVTGADAWYDGQAHVGYEGTPTSDFKGTYTVTYVGTGSTKYGPASAAPTAAGTYRVTISVPSTDSTWYGSVAVDFSIRSGSTVVGRFYAPAQGAQGLHMWTTSDVESAALGASGWNLEGDAFAMDAHVGTPVFRLYDPAGNQHLWTVSVEERDHLVSVGWNDEGVAFYENPTADVDVYRLYNPWTGEHLWTTSLLERDTLASLPDGAAWRYEGVAFKALA